LFASERAKKHGLTHAVVAGATGHLGAHIMQQLLEDGRYVVTCTTRDASRPKAKELHERFDVDMFECDMENDDGWMDAMAGADVVFIVAARIAIAKASYGDNPADLVRENSEGAVTMAKAAIAQGARHIVLTGSAGAVFGRENSKEIYADASVYSNVEYCIKRKQFYNASKTIAAQRVADLVRTHEGVRLTVITPAMCIGPSVLRSITERDIPESITMFLMKPFRQGYVADLDFYFIDYRDAARAHVQALNHIGDDTPRIRRIMALGWNPTHGLQTQETAMKYLTDKTDYFANRGLDAPHLLPHALGQQYIGGLSRHQGKRFVGGYDDAAFRQLLGRPMIPLEQTFADTLERLDEMGVMARRKPGGPLTRLAAKLKLEFLAGRAWFAVWVQSALRPCGCGGSAQ